jgi:isoaspartyl peptidase/L-asparaginase-like protein (Ntn-hydrolase superfamily)
MLLLSTWSFGLRGHAAAWPILQSGGSALDAVEAAARVIEDDAEVDSVGYGGLPDRDGGVSLDGAVMLGPSRCGSVAGMRRHRHPVSVARMVMERTPHVLLVGTGADDFADACGAPQEPLLSPGAAAAWERWTRDGCPVDQTRDALRPIDGGAPGRLFDLEQRHHDTIGVLAIDAQGALAGACSTSGTPFKLPGRVGDSPIIGHGLYVHPRHGAAVGTGLGELLMGVCGAFLAVELMRRGSDPRSAATLVLERVRESCDLRPDHQIALLVLRPDGQWSSAALRPGYLTSVTAPGRNEVVPPEVVLHAEQP